MKPLLAALLSAAWLSVLPPASAADGGQALEARSADRQVLERAISEGRVATSPPRPGPSLYVSDAGITFSAWLAEVVDRLLPGFGRLTDWFLAASRGLLSSVLVVLAVILGLGLARRWWRQRSRSVPSPTPAAPAVEAPAPRRSAKAREAELRRALADGDVAAAAEALWWWLASVLAPGGVEPSWTSRELAARAGRTDLGAQILRLDRMIYGRGTPSAEDVRELFRDLEEAA